MSDVDFNSEDCESDACSNISVSDDEGLPRLFNSSSRRKKTLDNFIAPPHLHDRIYRCREFPRGVYINRHGEVLPDDSRSGCLVVSSSLGARNTIPSDDEEESYVPTDLEEEEEEDEDEDAEDEDEIDYPDDSDDDEEEEDDEDEDEWSNEDNEDLENEEKYENEKYETDSDGNDDDDDDDERVREVRAEPDAGTTAEATESEEESKTVVRPPSALKRLAESLPATVPSTKRARHTTSRHSKRNRMMSAHVGLKTSDREQMSEDELTAYLSKALQEQEDDLSKSLEKERDRRKYHIQCRKYLEVIERYVDEWNKMKRKSKNYHATLESSIYSKPPTCTYEITIPSGTCTLEFNFHTCVMECRRCATTFGTMKEVVNHLPCES